MGSVYKSYGVHASGVLLSGQRINIADYIPTMLVASSNTTVTQFDMDDVEEFGVLKMDLLGQATLRSMKLANKLINPDGDPTDFTWIPFDDLRACSLLREGRTDTGIFHYEGYTKAKGGKELGIKSTMDAILGQALFMPGCMDVAPGMDISQKDLYIQRRRSPRSRRQIKYLHPAFEDALSMTHGAVVFQEQVIQIMRNLGMDIAGINTFFKVVKDSGRGSGERNAERMREVRQQFDSLCRKAKINPDEAWKQTASFVSYGFNRAHATGYGIRSYRTAYMKAHYSLEFMTGMLQTWAGRKKEQVYINESRRIGLRVLPPDVNNSQMTWAMERPRRGIRKGLLSIAGVGQITAVQIAMMAPYTSVEDMVERLPRRAISGGVRYVETGIESGTIGKLIAAGAMDSLIRTRE
jgi:DNA polymerase-3 subunit alpha